MRKVLAGLEEESRVLEIGAGSGSQLGFLVEMSSVSLSLYANELEFDQPAREFLLTRNVSLLEGPIEEVDIPVIFDAIICVQVIEHVLNPNEVFKWISNHLAPGGLLILETPDLNAPARYLFGSHWGALAFPRHFHLFSRKALSGLADRSGLELVSHYGTAAAAAWTLSIRNTLKMRATTEQQGLLKILDYKNVFALAVFTLVDWILMCCGLSTSNQMLIARKSMP